MCSSSMITDHNTDLIDAVESTGLMYLAVLQRHVSGSLNTIFILDGSDQLASSILLNGMAKSKKSLG